MTPIAEALKKEHPDKKEYLQNELKSLGIEPRRQNELNDKEELQALAESIKAVYYQDYKTAYNSSTCKGIDDKEVIIDKSHFDHII
jgi:Skp family chaperone for outer membrane proteins